VKRRLVITALVVVPVAAVVWWTANNTHWAETTIPMPLRGEARGNPFYAAQRFSESLGVRTAWDRAFTAPAPDAVIVLSGWHWTLSARRRESLERWVESGGRLVVAGDLSGGEAEFAGWSGIVRRYRKNPLAKDDETDSNESELPCRVVQEDGGVSGSAATQDSRRLLCHVTLMSTLSTNRQATWTLRDSSGIQAARVPVGEGSVTVINAEPFRYRNLLDGDHAHIFVAATELRRGDDLRFLSEDDHPSLVALAWRYGAPVVVLALVVVALHLWRRAVRFGPLAAPPERARRSLAEQIRGTGSFAWRHGGGESLHAACVRALDEAATRRIPGYGRSSPKERAAAVARLTGFEWPALSAAVHDSRARGGQELRSTIALLEEARRRILIKPRRRKHE
jgi:hypothetical protein